MALHIRHRINETPIRRVLLSIICTVAIGAFAAWLLPTPPPLQTRGSKMLRMVQTAAENVATPPPMQLIDLPPVNAPLLTDFFELRPPLPPQNIHLPLEMPTICAIDGLSPCTEQELMPAPDCLQAQEAQSPVPVARAAGSNPKASVYTPPQYISAPQPEYPAELQRRRIAGEVRVRIHVDASGKAHAVDILASPHPRLSQAVQYAVLNFWRFRAATQGKKSIASTVVTSVLFEL